MNAQQTPGTRIVAGRGLRCPVCGHDQFRSRRTLMSRRWRTFFDFAWTDRQALNEICTQCGHVLWFLPPRD